MAHPLLINVFTALKGSQFYFLFAITAAGVVPCGGPKKSPRTSSIVQVIFMSPPDRVGRHIVFPRASVRPSVRLSVCLSVRHKSCPLYNLKTVKDFSMKLDTLVNHDETMCHEQEP